MNYLKTLVALAFALVFCPAPGSAQTIIGSLPYTSQDTRDLCA